MERKPLDALISKNGLWVSRSGHLHGIKRCETSQKYIRIEMDCGEIVVQGQAAQILEDRELLAHHGLAPPQTT